MDPVSLIVGALAAGTAPALKEVSGQAIKDSYQALKTAVIHFWKSKTDGDSVKLEQEAVVLIENLESDPETFLVPFKKKFEQIAISPPQELIEKAQMLYKLLDEKGFKEGKYNLSVKDCQGVQIGDRNTQNNNFKL